MLCGGGTEQGPLFFLSTVVFKSPGDHAPNTNISRAVPNSDPVLEYCARVCLLSTCVQEEIPHVFCLNCLSISPHYVWTI